MITLKCTVFIIDCIAKTKETKGNFSGLSTHCTRLCNNVCIYCCDVFDYLTSLSRMMVLC